LIYKRQHDAAMAEFERAFALNPNFIDYRYALALMYAAEPARAIEVLQAIIRLDPFPPSPTFGQMGMASYMRKRYGDAVHWCANAYRAAKAAVASCHAGVRLCPVGTT